MVLPELSHLQYLALTLIGEADGLEGQDLQAKIGGRGGGDRSGPAFYMFMGRMEAAGLVKKKEEPRGRTRIASYKLTSKGRKSMKANEKFYIKSATEGGRL